MTHNQLKCLILFAISELESAKESDSIDVKNEKIQGVIDGLKSAVGTK